MVHKVNKPWWVEGLEFLALLALSFSLGILLALAFGAWIIDKVLFFWRW